MKNIWSPIVLILTFLLVSCSENESRQSNIRTEHSTIRTEHSPHADPLTASISFKKGDVVPHNEVCMVNDAFMGKQQIEVSHGGKMYYGCCEKCQARIQQDESVRMAIDPVSKKRLDKAKAVIAITGDKSEVSYFENRANYKVFFDK